MPCRGPWTGGCTRPWRSVWLQDGGGARTADFAPCEGIGRRLVPSHSNNSSAPAALWRAPRENSGPPPPGAGPPRAAAGVAASTTPGVVWRTAPPIPFVRAEAAHAPFGVRAACGALRHQSLRLTQTPCGGRRAPSGGARNGMRGRWCTPQPRLRPPHNPSGGSASPACGPPHLRGAFFTSTAFTRRKREFGGRFINSPFGAQGAGGRDAVAFWPLGRSEEMWPGARRGLLWLSPQRAPTRAFSARRTTFRASPECSRSHRARAF